jgi:sialic acid synthase SpsE
MEESMIKVIAECGLNFDSFESAVEYAEKALEIGSDIIKYQYVKKDSPYSQLTKGEWKALKEWCDRIGIEFLATPSNEEIACYLTNQLGVKMIKIGSDRSVEQWAIYKFLGLDRPDIKLLMSDGYYNFGNMYCVSLYPCDTKFIDFDKMADKKYIAFSDHTLRHDKEWCDKIKACTNIQYVEKHFKLDDNCIDSDVSLGYNEMKEFIENLKG